MVAKMGMRNHWEEVATNDGKMPVFCCTPEAIAKPLAAVIVLQEIFGVNHHVRDVAQRVASLGYATFAPDLFYRGGARFESGYAEMGPGIARARAVTEERFLADMRALRDFIAKIPEIDANRIASMGFCMGGRLSYLLACSQKLTAAASFYGGGIASGPVEKTRDLSCPILLFFGGLDKHIPRSDVETIRHALQTEQKHEFEVVVYPDADHGFFCDERASFQPEAAKLAWEKLRAFFQARLGQ